MVKREKLLVTCCWSLVTGHLSLAIGKLENWLLSIRYWIFLIWNLFEFWALFFGVFASKTSGKLIYKHNNCNVQYALSVQMNFELNRFQLTMILIPSQNPPLILKTKNHAVSR
jgi:hypothetical protein